MELLGSPAARSTRSIHVTGTNGKTSVARMTTALLVAAGPVGGHRHQPVPRARSTSGCRGTASPSPTTSSTELLVRDRRRRAPPAPTAPSYFEIINAAALRLVRRHRGRRRRDRGGPRAALGRHQRGRRPRSRSSPTSSIDHVEYLGPTREDIAEEKAGIVKPGATLVLGETDPELVPIFTRARARARRAPRRRLRRSATTARDRRPSARPLHAVRRRTPTCSSRCTARTRPTTRRSRSPPPSAFLERALDSELVADAFAIGAVAGSARSGRAQPARACIDGMKNVAGARAVRAALDEEFPHAHAHLGRRRAAAEGAARDARRARRRRRRPRRRAAGPRARARRDPHEVADAARDARRRPRDTSR